jgi:hypothetical protein
VVSVLATFRVPDRDRDMLVALLTLDRQAAEQLCRDIEASDGTAGAVAELLDKQQLDGRGAWSALMSLMLATRRLGTETQILVNSLKQSFGVEDGGEGLSALLQNPVIDRFAKALSLRNEYERILDDTRILTDIRPVFDEDADNPAITAAIVNHTLRFSYTSGDGESHESHFALDISDLNKLRKQIDKAIKKDKAARTMAEAASIIVMQPVGESE